LTSPLDAEEVRLRLDTYVRAKLDADHAKDDCLIDELTGLYNQRGLEQRARELASLAFRRHGALACVAVTPHVETTGDAPPAQVTNVVRQVGEAFREFGRRSDAIGRISSNEFAIIALDTDSTGAVKLAERLTQAAVATSPPGQAPTLRFQGGYDAVPDYHKTPIEPGDMLGRAEQALHTERKDEGEDKWIRGYTEGR
jgi:diguanylate cyclase (GGDEF)-like protein